MGNIGEARNHNGEVLVECHINGDLFAAVRFFSVTELLNFLCDRGSSEIIIALVWEPRVAYL